MSFTKNDVMFSVCPSYLIFNMCLYVVVNMFEHVLSKYFLQVSYVLLYVYTGGSFMS